ncbi:hypothetical protein [Halorhabdus rudnickae]|uniref:hypothetical protein n=1 Tax=Halorhabdus rudnickae TaxID=1775544 RepID=UPI0010841FBC|nr:hypothetical protein [Halorhabdus rudnickae]
MSRSTSRFPKGAIAQVETGVAHRTFLESVEPDYALLKIQYARRLLKQEETAESWFPEGTTVITSTAIRDDQNAALPIEGNGHKRGEADIVREFGPDFHIPADRSDYQDLEDAERYEHVRECMTGTVTLANHIADGGWDTQIVPFVKGVTPKERWLCYRTMEQLGLEYAALYANGYFNDGTGIGIGELVEDLELIAEESAEMVESVDGPLRLMVLNCLSPQVLERFPENVEAASGLWVGQRRGWREKVVPMKQEPAEMRRIYGDVEERVAKALSVPRTEREEASASASTERSPAESEGVGSTESGGESATSTEVGGKGE